MSNNILTEYYYCGSLLALGLRGRGVFAFTRGTRSSIGPERLIVGFVAVLSLLLLQSSASAPLLLLLIDPLLLLLLLLKLSIRNYEVLRSMVDRSAFHVVINSLLSIRIAGFADALSLVLSFRCCCCNQPQFHC